MSIYYIYVFLRIIKKEEKKKIKKILMRWIYGVFEFYLGCELEFGFENLFSSFAF